MAAVIWVSMNLLMGVDRDARGQVASACDADHPGLAKSEQSGARKRTKTLCLVALVGAILLNTRI